MVVVLDTNIVLDCWVFDDPASQGLRDGLNSARVRWLATAPMRDELARVLTYPHIIPRLTFHGREADSVLAWFDAFAQLQEVPPKAPVTCKDLDDQKFIDLAVAHRCPLLSKDHAVLSMSKRLLALGVNASTAINLEANLPPSL